MATTITLPIGKNFIAWVGPTTTINATNFSWVTPTILSGVYAINTNRSGYISYKTNSNFPAVTQFVLAPTGSLPNCYELDLKQAITVDSSLFYLIGATSNPPTKLAAPLGLSASATSATSLGVSWNQVANATGYRLQRATDAGFTQAVSIVYSSTGTSYVDNGLTTGTTYYYRVLAESSGAYGNSDYSAAISAATPAAAGATGHFATTGKSFKLCFDGNSIMFGFAGDLAGEVVAEFRSYLASIGDMRQVHYDLSGDSAAGHPDNVAISGQTEQQMVDSFADMASTYDGAYDCIAISLERYNQIRGFSTTTTAQQAFNIFKQYDALVQQSPFIGHVAYNTPPDAIFGTYIASLSSDNDPGTSNYRTRADFPDVALGIAQLMEQDVASGAKYEVADILRTTLYDAADPSQTQEGIHPLNPAIQMKGVAAVAVDALKHAVFNVAKPAPRTASTKPFYANHYPNGGAAGAVIHVTGSNFDTVTGVRVGGVAAAISSKDYSRLSFTIPSGASSSTFLLTNPQGSATSSRALTVSSTSQPAPPSHYLSGYSALPDLIFNNGAVVYQSGGVASTAGGSADYGTALAVFGGHLAAQTSWVLLNQYIVANGTRDGIMGVNDNDSPEAYQNLRLSFYTSGGRFLYRRAGGGFAYADGGTPLSDGEYFGLRCTYSADGTTAYDLVRGTSDTNLAQSLALPDTFSATLRIKCDIFGTGRIDYPQAKGLSS